MTFAQHVQEKKKEKGLTSAELAQRAGIPLGTLNKLLSGVIEEPKLSTAIALAGALGCSLSALVDEGEALYPPEERVLLSAWRRLDEYGRTMVRAVLDMESGRRADAEDLADNSAIAPRVEDEDQIEIPLFLTPISAGLGMEVGEAPKEHISVRRTPVTEKADFALRVRGNSMEPRFLDGDVLLIHQQESINFGELGAFIADGEGYFKRYMGDRLHSLNPAYPDIPISRFTEFFCCGKVVGHMKKKGS